MTEMLLIIIAESEKNISEAINKQPNWTNKLKTNIIKYYKFIERRDESR